MMLDPRQRELLDRWVPEARLVADLSWGLVESTVLHMSRGQSEIIVKAGGRNNHHIAREITAYESVVPLLGDRGSAPRLLYADRGARILVTTYIRGTLVADSDLEGNPKILRQAGTILRDLHECGNDIDDTIERNLITAALKWLDKPHRICPSSATRARQMLSSYETGPASVVPSHGDYSGRNWLRTNTGLAVIDFGRFGHRPPRQDFLRLFFRRWHDHPAEREHFVEGYGRGMEIDGYAWWIDVLREAVATAGWAHKVNDEPFEKLGLRFIDVALAELDT